MTATLFPDALDLPVVKDRVRKRERIQGPRVGDWVIMLDGSWQRLTSGLGEFSSWIGKNEQWPIDGVADPKNPSRVNHPCFATDWMGGSAPGSFMLLRDGTAQHSGGNDFHNVSRRTRLLDTEQTKPGAFRAFEMNHPDLGKRGVSFELPCRVYRVSEDY